MCLFPSAAAIRDYPMYRGTYSIMLVTIESLVEICSCAEDIRGAEMWLRLEKLFGL